MLFLDISHIALMFPFNWGKLVSMLVCIRDQLDQFLKNVGSLNYWWLLNLFTNSISKENFSLIFYCRVCINDIAIYNLNFFLLFIYKFAKFKIQKEIFLMILKLRILKIYLAVFKKLFWFLLFIECVVVPDDWIVIHPQLIADHSYGLFCWGVCMGSQIYKGYVICISCKFHK